MGSCAGSGREGVRAAGGWGGAGASLSRWGRDVRRLGAGALLLLALLPGAKAAAEGGDEQSRFLEVRRQQVALKAARAEHARLEELFEQGLESRTELERAATAVEIAQLNYQEAVLSLLALQPRITIREAVKHQAADGRKLVRLTVSNLTPTFDDTQFQLLANFEGADPIPERLRTRDLRDIYISLKSSSDGAPGAPEGGRGTTIALPYEVHLSQLAYGQSRTLEFQLLRDVGSVLVALSYKGQQREIDIQLQQAETARAVSVTAGQISQEADLGGQATYDLRLERSSVDSRRFQLRLLNLPQQIAYSFLDPGSEARLSQINFPPGVTQKDLRLRLFLPDRADDTVRLDAPLELWVAVVEPGAEEAFADARTYEAEEIQGSRAGIARLELIPRGVGRIELSAVSLFSEIHAGDKVETRLRVENTGSRRLDNVQLSAETPIRWQVELSPSTLPELGIHQQEDITLTIVPPPETPVGDYEVRIKSESYAYNRRVPAEEKIYRVSVKARSNVLGISLLISSLLLLVTGIVTFGIKLTRR